MEPEGGASHWRGARVHWLQLQLPVTRDIIITHSMFPCFNLKFYLCLNSLWTWTGRYETSCQHLSRWFCKKWTRVRRNTRPENIFHYIVDSVVNYFNHIPKSSWNTKIRNRAVNAFIHLWFVWLNPTKSKSLPFLYISFHLTYSSSFYTHRIHPLLPWECSFPQFCPPCWSDNHSESRA